MSSSTLRDCPTAIFDFDGTIADSMDVVVTAYNRVAPMLRVRKLDPEGLPALRRMPPQQALKEHAISAWKLPLLVVLVRAAMREHVASLRPFAAIPPVLHALRAAGCRCSILSTNSSANIGRFLAQHQLTLFDDVAGGASMFGKGRALRKLLTRHRLDARQVFYVGDEARDVHAAQQAGVRSIAVSWGYGDRQALSAASPDHLVDEPAQLVELLAAR